MTRAVEVVIAVRRGDEFLVLLRAPHKEGYWHLVAGGVEENETHAEAAARELLEETALEVATLEDVGDDLGYDGVRVHAFAADAPPGWEPTLDDEHVDRRWCSLDDALQLLEFEEAREVVRRAAVLFGERS